MFVFSSHDKGLVRISAGYASKTRGQLYLSHCGEQRRNIVPYSANRRYLSIALT
jgi:hypothetical protein